MVPHTTRLLFSEHFPDRSQMEAVVRLGSSPSACEAARAWLAAYHAARAGGTGEGEARRRADAAFHQVVAQSVLPSMTQVAERRAA
jgi:hypothetical protein